ncbi:hypothetical protein PsYK624_115930 [Phanerochaete sordida]|uniref:Uncharacterized protein n=1 Tax=Phanerochaete sordida TaxID=48140 RepID=A0A9P3LI83_9APHY|nr:hypothetical protein PsYK624_115930 [Phanerochaete sordida]
MRTFPAVRTLRIGDVILYTLGFSIAAGVAEDAEAQLRGPKLHALLTLSTLALRCPVVHIETALRAWPDANPGHLVVLLHDSTTPRRSTLTTYPAYLAQLLRVLDSGALAEPELRMQTEVTSIAAIDDAGRKEEDQMSRPRGGASSPLTYR